MMQQIEVHYKIKVFFIFLILLCCCSAKKDKIVDEFCLPTNNDIQEFEGKIYAEDIFIKDTISFSNYGTDSFYRLSPILLKKISSNLESDYRYGSFVLYKSDSIINKLKTIKAFYHDEAYLYNLLDSLYNNDKTNKRYDLALIKKFKKKGLKSSFRYKEMNLKIVYIYSGCHKIWIPNFKENNRELVKQVKVPIYSVIDIRVIDNDKNNK